MSYVEFSKLCHVIKYFPELNQKLGKKILIFLYPQVQEPLNDEIDILVNQNHMWIKLIQSYTITTQSMKDDLRIPLF